MVGQTNAEFPGGCFLGFNWGIDRPSSGRLVESVAGAHAEGYEEVDILLSCSGGTLVDAHYAVECLAAMPVKLVMWNMSAVQSAANMLFAIGVERFAVPGSFFYFHQTGFDGVAGQRNSETEVREQLRIIEAGDRKSAAFISERTGVDADVIGEWQRTGRTLTDIEAKAAGLVHDIRRPVIPPDGYVRQVLPNFL